MEGLNYFWNFTLSIKHIIFKNLIVRMNQSHKKSQCLVNVEGSIYRDAYTYI